MVEILQELLIENFRKVHTELGEIKQVMRDIRGEFISLRQQDSNLHNDHTLLESRVVSLENKVERINCRLDLHE